MSEYIVWVESNYFADIELEIEADTAEQAVGMVSCSIDVNVYIKDEYPKIEASR